MRALAMVGILFAAAGVGFLVLGWSLTSSERAFVASAAKAHGTVVAQRAQKAGGSPTATLCPVVSFVAASGKQIEVSSGPCTHPPAYRRGERVTVLYDPAIPSNAKIESFMAQWFEGALFGGLGGAFELTAIILLAVPLRAARIRQSLLRHGVKVRADLVGADLTDAVLGRKRGFRLTANWQDPSSGKIHVFHSETIWFNPRPFLGSRKEVEVLIDPNNPRHHLVDLSFLPSAVQAKAQSL